jgi:hypothetical protein
MDVLSLLYCASVSFTLCNTKTFSRMEYCYLPVNKRAAPPRAKPEPSYSTINSWANTSQTAWQLPTTTTGANSLDSSAKVETTFHFCGRIGGMSYTRIPLYLTHILTHISVAFCGFFGYA